MHNVYYKHLILGDAQVPREVKVLFFFFLYKNVRTIDSNETVYILPAAHAVLFQARAMYQIRMNIMLRVYVLLWGLVRYCSTRRYLKYLYNIFASSTENSINIIIKTVALLPLVYVILGCVSWSRHHRPGAPQCWTDDLRGECVNNGQSSRWNVNWKYKINRGLL